MRKWYESEKASTGTIVGGQICLVRNIAGYCFEDKMDAGQQESMTEAVRHAVLSSEENLKMKFDFLNLSEMKAYEREALIGRLVVPPQMLVRGRKSVLFRSEDESVTILVNGSEHICIQVSCAGPNIRDAMDTANAADDCLNRELKYAFSKKYGYLTASPLYTGTGMSASYLMYLPYLEKKEQIGRIEKELGQCGYTLRAHFHGQTPAPGSVYRVKNRRTLGLSENDIISSLEQLTSRLAGQERETAQKELTDNNGWEMDQMYRAYGLLKYARDLNYDETMEYLSIVHGGDTNGVWSGTDPLVRFYMMTQISEAVLTAEADRDMKNMATGEARAEFIRQNLGVMEA